MSNSALFSILLPAKNHCFWLQETITCPEMTAGLLISQMEPFARPAGMEVT